MVNLVQRNLQEEGKMGRESSESFNLYLQNCIPDMKYKFQSINEWVSSEVTKYGSELIKMTRSISNQHNESKQGVTDIYQSDNHMYLTYQTSDMLNAEYFDQFKACVDFIKGLW